MAAVQANFSPSLGRTIEMVRVDGRKQAGEWAEEISQISTTFLPARKWLPLIARKARVIYGPKSCRFCCKIRPSLLGSPPLASEAAARAPKGSLAR